jgi:hypothetical protein
MASELIYKGFVVDLKKLERLFCSSVMYYIIPSNIIEKNIDRFNKDMKFISYAKLSTLQLFLDRKLRSSEYFLSNNDDDYINHIIKYILSIIIIKQRDKVVYFNKNSKFYRHVVNRYNNLLLKYKYIITQIKVVDVQLLISLVNEYGDVKSLFTLMEYYPNYINNIVYLKINTNGILYNPTPLEMGKLHKYNTMINI